MEHWQENGLFNEMHCSYALIWSNNETNDLLKVGWDECLKK